MLRGRKVYDKVQFLSVKKKGKEERSEKRTDLYGLPSISVMVELKLPSGLGYRLWPLVSGTRAQVISFLFYNTDGILVRKRMRLPASFVT